MNYFQLLDDWARQLVDGIEEFPASRHVEGLSAALARGTGSLPRSQGIADVPHARLLGAMSKVIEVNEFPLAAARAHYERARLLEGKPGATEDDLALAIEDRKKAAELLPEDSLLSKQARGPLYAKERLQVGMTAPDLVSTDMEGKDIKLADFEGKVTILKFWGTT